MLDLSRIDAAPLQRDPFDFFVASGLLGPEGLRAVARDFPDIEDARNVPLEEVVCHGAFQQLIDELRSPAFAKAVGEKLGFDVSGRPNEVSVRAFSDAGEGAIHPDAERKLVTILLYLNEDWPHEGGRLRLLRSSTDIEDYAAEVVPEKGNLLGFRRCDRSFHGHKPYAGPRRAIQLSWLDPKPETKGGRRWRKLTRRLRRIFSS